MAERIKIMNTVMSTYVVVYSKKDKRFHTINTSFRNGIGKKFGRYEYYSSNIASALAEALNRGMKTMKVKQFCTQFDEASHPGLTMIRRQIVSFCNLERAAVYADRIMFITGTCTRLEIPDMED